MGKVNALEVLKQCFKKIVPEKDVRQLDYIELPYNGLT